MTQNLERVHTIFGLNYLLSHKTCLEKIKLFKVTEKIMATIRPEHLPYQIIYNDINNTNCRRTLINKNYFRVPSHPGDNSLSFRQKKSEQFQDLGRISLPPGEFICR